MSDRSTSCRQPKRASSTRSRPAPMPWTRSSKPLGDYTHFTPVYPPTSTGRRPGAGPLDHVAGQPARGPRGHQSHLAAAFRLAARADRVRLRHERQAADQPAAARLAGRRADGERLADEAHSQADRDEPDVSAGVSTDRVKIRPMTKRIRIRTRILRSIPRTSTTGEPTRAGWRPRSFAMRRCSSPARST